MQDETPNDTHAAENLDENDDSTQPADPLTVTPPEQDVVCSQPNRRKSIEFLARIKQKRMKKLNTSETLAKCMVRMVDNMDKSNSDARGPFSIPICLEILERLPGVEENVALWMYATRIFLKPEIRVLFVSFKNDEQRLRWLEHQMEKDSGGDSNNSNHGSRGVDSQENGTSYSG